MVKFRTKNIYFKLIAKIGTIVANKKDQNNKNCEINVGNIFVGNNIPTRMLWEKSGVGNNNNPIIKPNNIETNAFFSFRRLL